VSETANTSSSPAVEDRLIRVPLAQLRPHPRNANLMSAERLEKLARNITAEGRYPPLIVRPHAEGEDAYQVIDGHQRLTVLARLGHQTALCFLWPCDDATALLLLATLNRLEGEDVPARRAELLAELSALLPAEALAQLLPEDARAIEQTMALLDFDSDQLLVDLAAAAERAAAGAPRLISFAVLPEDEPVIERAVAEASATLSGLNQRGRAIAAVCRQFLDEVNDG
jgi:ParB-like chromosome segregation protein Spo0J